MTSSTDVVVVGGGVIGCAVAYELAKRSVAVTLLDKSLPGRATSASAGGLWPVGEAVGLGCGIIYHKNNLKNGNADDTVPHDVGMLPDVFRDFLVRSNRAFPSLADELREQSGVDIEYVPGVGLLFLVYEEQEKEFVSRVGRSLPAEFNLEYLAAEEVWEMEPRLTRDLAGAALLTGEHQVNPMMLAEAFKRAAIQLGATFRHDTRVGGLCREGDRITGVKIGDEFLAAGVVVNAAGSWSGRFAASAELSLPVYPVRGQIVLTEALPRALNSCLSTTGCYLAQKSHGEVLIGSTTEKVGFDVSVTANAVTSMCRESVRAVPMLRHVGIKRVWAGLRPGTPDELPVLGPVDGVSGYFNATGGFRTGIVASPLTARLVAQCVIGEPPEVDVGPYLVDRFRGRQPEELWAAESTEKE